MKRLGTILLACALILGMSQCKKENTNTNTNAEGEPVHIVLKVDNDGQRCNLDPTTGAYDFTTGDILLVGYNGEKVGELTYSSASGEFSGNITIDELAETAQPLNFYYLNGESYTPNADGECTVDISDQRDGLPVLAYGVSNETFPSDTYSAHLQNKCALVKFNLYDEEYGPGTYMDVVVTGMKNLMKIDFSDNSIDYDLSSDGEIHLYHQTPTEKWAVLLPQDPVDASYWVGYDIGQWLEYGCGSYYVSLPKITPNAYINQDINQQDLTLVYNSGFIPEQFDPSSFYSHYFTVDQNNTKVQFSSGNLQYDCSSYEWQFAQNQWDIMAQNGTINVENGDLWKDPIAEDRPLDLFAWDTWGRGEGEPWTIIGEDMPRWIGYIMSFVEFDEEELDNCTNWRTLSTSEWSYLLTRSSGATIGNTVNACYARATLDTDGDDIDEVHGIILFPDNYVHPSTVRVPLDINVSEAVWDRNVYNIHEWYLMASVGAVFLPAAGRRGSLEGEVVEVNNECYYWSTTEALPYNLYHGQLAMDWSCTQARIGSALRDKKEGCSVRLVRNAD